MRFFNTVGPRQTGRYGMVVPRFVQQALRQEPITVYGDGQQSRCFTYVGDVVRAMVGLADEPQAVGEVFNLGSTEEVTIEHLARRTIALAGSPSPIVYVPYDQAYERALRTCAGACPISARSKRSSAGSLASPWMVF